MPEVIRYVCDMPACEVDGDVFIVRDANQSVRVILCGEHRQPIDNAFQLGTPDDSPRRGDRGLSRERLNSLRRDPDSDAQT